MLSLRTRMWAKPVVMLCLHPEKCLPGMWTVDKFPIMVLSPQCPPSHTSGCQRRLRMLPITKNTMPRHQPVSPLRPARPLYINEKEDKREGGCLPDSVCLLSHYVFLRFIQLSCPPTPPHVMIVLGHVWVRERMGQRDDAAYSAARRAFMAAVSAS